MMTKKEKMKLINQVEAIVANIRSDIYYTSVDENTESNINKLKQAILNLIMIKDEMYLKTFTIQKL